MSAQFSGPVSVFHDRRLPETAVPAGYAALIDAYKLAVPVPRTLSAIGTKHRIIEQGGWRIYTPRHAPEPSLEGHLTFALKNEGLDLAVLKRLFLAVKEGEIAELVRQTPTGLYTRRIWFLYEWLLGRRAEAAVSRQGLICGCGRYRTPVWRDRRELDPASCPQQPSRYAGILPARVQVC